MMNLTVVPVQLIDAKNNWCVEPSVRVSEILEKDKTLKKYFGDVSDALITIDDFIDILESNKTLYKKYADFIEVAIDVKRLHEELADYIYELCKLIKDYDYELGYLDENGEMDYGDAQQELIDLVDYLTDNKELELPKLCMSAWDYMNESGNFDAWLLGKIEMTMFLGQPKKANEEYDLLWILKAIKEQMGIDYNVDWYEDAHVWVTFKLHYKKHFMQLDDLIFDYTKTRLNKADIILDSLIYYFNLEEYPVEEFVKVIKKEFKIYEAEDNEIINVNVLDEHRVEVRLVDNKTGEERLFEGWLDEDVTFENASQLGYEVSHEMMTMNLL